MTIIVWDGKRLAGDRFTTSSANKVDETRHQEVNKVILPTRELKVGNSPRATKLLAYGLSGKVSSITKLIAIIEKLDEGTDVLATVNGVFKQQLSEPQVSILLVSKNLTIIRGGCAQHKPVQTEFCAIGSGARLAYGLQARFPELTAVDCVYLASVLHKGFGGGISSYNSDKDTLRVIRKLSKKRREKLSTLFSEAILSGIYPSLETGAYVAP